ncbi:MAG: EthD family reductase [Bacteroidota bacterium]
MKNSIRIFTLAILLFAATNVMAQANSTKNQPIKKGMIKVAILYPGGEGKTFDMNYYVNKHFPLLRTLCGDALKATAIDKGVAGSAPGAPIPFVAVGYLYFDTLEAYQNAMKTNVDKIRADIPNYTNIQPVIQVSEVVE